MSEPGLVLVVKFPIQQTGKVSQETGEDDQSAWNCTPVGEVDGVLTAGFPVAQPIGACGW